jgi:hypothetical protein
MHPYEELPMNIAGFALAAWLIGFHLWMLLKKEKAKDFLVKFPRNFMWGAVMMAVGTFWFWLLIVPGLEKSALGYLSMDIGEFNALKKYLAIAVPVAAYLMITEVKEFLAVRALGLLSLMASAPLLYSCFQDWPTGKLLLPIYAYAMLTAGMFMVGMPYLLRDVIHWVVKDDKRWLACAGGGLVYGVAVLICAIFFWGGY